MVDEYWIQQAREEEQSLLRRCRAFVLGGPGSPGGGPEDVVYLTPDGRWLRICFAGLLECYPGPGPEGAAWLSSAAAAAVFESYGHPQPAELPDNRERDAEVNDGSASDFYSELYTPMNESSLAELKFLEGLGDSVTVPRGGVI